MQSKIYLSKKIQKDLQFGTKGVYYIALPFFTTPLYIIKLELNSFKGNT
jgi:hypothetical protein